MVLPWRIAPWLTITSSSMRTLWPRGASTKALSKMAEFVPMTMASLSALKMAKGQTLAPDLIYGIPDSQGTPVWQRPQA
jgi:hypothetical protein